MALNQHKISLVVTAENLTRRTFKAIERDIKGLGRHISRVNAAFASLGAAVSLGAVIRATREQEKALAQLEARLKSTGGVAGLSKQQLVDFAAALQQTTTYGDEAVLSMQSLLLTFTNVRGRVFEEATRATLDLATAMGTDLKSAALQVGKALNDPVKGISALTRVGVSFSRTQKQTIRALVETGDVAGAQRVILEELKREFGGAAQAAADTFGGALQQLQNALGDLLEAPGGLDDAKRGVQELTRLFQDPAFVHNINVITTAMIEGFGKAARFVADAAGAVKYLSEELAAMMNGAAADDIVRLEEKAQELRDALNGGLIGFGKRIRFFGKGGVVEFWSEEELRAELAKIEKAIKAYYDSRPLPKPAQPKALPDNPTGQPYNVSGAGTTTGTGLPDKTAAAYQNALAQLQKMSALTGATTERERVLWEVQNGRFKDLNDNQKRALIQAAEAVDARRRQLEQAQALAKTREEEQRALEAYNQEQEAAAQRWRELINPMEEVDAQLVQLDTLLAEGRISWDTYAEAVFRVTEAMDEVPAKSEEARTQLDQFAVQAARNIQSAFADFLFNPFDHGVKGMLRSFVDAVRRMAAEAIAAQLARKLFGDFGKTGKIGGIFGEIFSAIGFAEGGYVTGPGTATSDSIPARLSAGEYVLNAAAVRRVGVQFLDSLNQNFQPPVWRGPALAFANGGLVPAAGGAGAQQLNVTLVDNRHDAAEEVLMGATGERSVILHIQRNAEQIKRLLT